MKGQTMHITPAEGLKIIDPARIGTPDEFLPVDGREVESSDYWTRRLRDGDVSLSVMEDRSATAPE